ncbi:hypothetical protein SAMN05444412_1187 [Rhodonellum ikkaensis]|uniref:Uncharacterized protein n=1 Tax=Rhodonellum ikkaensis TaxID=336829 RepID=A0A1H3TJL4_9BACT|nr:hypothetical protein SAMN05444412_1187 [Rhodonellum ikkaensis]
MHHELNSTVKLTDVQLAVDCFDFTLLVSGISLTYSLIFLQFGSHLENHMQISI